MLNKVSSEHASRLVAVLGERHSREVGLIE